MFVLVFLAVIFFWLVVGAVQYLACVAVPRLRRYALSAALWWAVWGPCSVALMMLAGLAIVAGEAVRSENTTSVLHDLHLPASFGWGYCVLGVIGTAGIATIVAWVHQALVRRFTFALFRLYATVVSAGIGSVFGWCFSCWIASNGWSYGWILAISGMVIFIGAFGVLAYKYARALRGDAPTILAWVSPSEFEGA